MSDRMQALAQQITGKESVDDCSLDDVKQITHRYPYFAPAQFLLLQKLRQANLPEEAEAQYRKAVLFFHDPLLFEHFISTNDFHLGEITESLPATGFPPETKTFSAREPEENGATIAGAEMASIDLPSGEETAEKGETFHEEEPELALQNESIVNDSSLIETEINNHSEKDEAEQNEVAQPPTEEPLIVVTTQAAKELTFEPFHTVDYFASQGIKITQDELPKDKLGKQLKSFTEWLKTMKRLPSSQLTDNVESSAERKVESMASHSVSQSDVVTEAMAEVWLKQGNREKALDIYNKLSLLNPSKNAYFAAKIENLKLS